MGDIVLLSSDSSSDSIEELEAPKKLPPPLIDLAVDDIILNVEKNVSPRILVENGLKDDDVSVSSPGDNPTHWTKDMIKFYNEDWGDEDKFIVEKLQEKMDKCPSLWRVAPRDMYFIKNRKNKSFRKCWNCCQFGHTVQQCMEPVQLPKCHMCGLEGHVEKSCPNAICLNCGNQMRSFVLWCNNCSREAQSQCSRCYLFGHHFMNCSDNWRRYHSTIGKTDINIPQCESYKAEQEMWCCNCGKKGHNEIHCPIRKQCSFPQTLPFVSSYETVFSEVRPNMKKKDKQVQKRSKKSKRKRKYWANSNPKVEKERYLKFIRELNNPKRKKKRKKSNNLQTDMNADFIPI